MTRTVVLACLMLGLLAAGGVHFSGFFWQSTPSPGMGSAWAIIARANIAVKIGVCMLAKSMLLADLVRAKCI
jgi:hypothetical protein